MSHFFFACIFPDFQNSFENFPGHKICSFLNVHMNDTIFRKFCWCSICEILLLVANLVSWRDFLYVPFEEESRIIFFHMFIIFTWTIFQLTRSGIAKKKERNGQTSITQKNSGKRTFYVFQRIAKRNPEKNFITLAFSANDEEIGFQKKRVWYAGSNSAVLWISRWLANTHKIGTHSALKSSCIEPWAPVQDTKKLRTQQQPGEWGPGVGCDLGGAGLGSGGHPLGLGLPLDAALLVGAPQLWDTVQSQLGGTSIRGF